MSLWKKITAPTGPNANILIRFVVGGVFLNEGILKFLYPMPDQAFHIVAWCRKSDIPSMKRFSIPAVEPEILPA
jgi:hypothetical protein